MKTLAVSYGRQQIKLDDEDYERLKHIRWRIYYYKDRVPFIRGWCRKTKTTPSLPSMFVPEGLNHRKYLIRFLNGDKMDWRKQNLEIVLQGTNQNEFFKVPWCPHGKATIVPGPRGRSEQCIMCPDHLGGPYWKCLSLTAKTHWEGWRRKSEEES